jgi:hypothetical protein
MTPAVVKQPQLLASMAREERSDLILAFARVLYVNGESIQQTLAAAKRLGDFLGLRAIVLPRWGELELKAEDATNIHFSSRGRSCGRRHGPRCFDSANH